MARQQFEYDDSQSEKVNSSASICFAFVDLGRHVVRRSQVGPVLARGISTFSLCSKAKIDYLYIMVHIEHDVGRLKVTVGYTLIMDVIDSTKHLLGKVANKFFFKWPCFTDPTEQFTFWDHLLHDVGHLFLLTIVFPQYRILIKFVVLDNVLVVQLRPNDALFTQHGEGCFLNPFENLHSVLLVSMYIYGELDC